jgi:hemerythrin-like metal-binding protein
MGILTWDATFSVGVPQIDNEHRLLCALINDLLRVTDASLGVQIQVVDQALQGLLDCIRRHFASEEQLLLENGYPEYEAHQSLHRVLENGLEHFRAHGTLVVNKELIDFLCHWFLDHLQSEDQKYAAFLKSR